MAVVLGGVSRKRNLRQRLNAGGLLGSAICGGVKEAGLGSERSSTMIQWLKKTTTTSAIPIGSSGAGWGWMALQDCPKLGWAGQTFIIRLPFNSWQFRVSRDSWRMASYSYWVSFPPAGPSFSDFFVLNLLILLFPGSWPTNQAFTTVMGPQIF